VRQPRFVHASVVFAVLFCLAPLAGHSQSKAAKPVAPPAAPTPDDVVIFTNGDQLTGKLERAEGGHLVFASKMAGELNIPFDNVKELRSGEQFALLRKDTVPTANYEYEGSVRIAEKKVYVTEANGTSFIEADKDVAYLVPKKDFDQQMTRKAGFATGWAGSIGGGAALVRSTDTSTTLTVAAHMVRAVPTVAWMPPRNRTLFNVLESYGKANSPVIPQTVPASPPAISLTSIFHADAERDEYFKPTFYALGVTSFDHNYSQGLQLQQVFGAGVGWTAVKNPKQELDLVANLHYEKQVFQAIGSNVNLIGITASEAYRRNLPRKVVFTQTASILPSINEDQDYSANLTAGFTLPIFKHLTATISGVDSYLNNPSPGYKTNSVQLITNVNYVLP